MMGSGADSDSGNDSWSLCPIARGDLVASKYEAESVIGVGGMGVVVGARDTVLERRVAIKFLLPRLASSETGVQRFVREARVSASITSEHAVRLLEIDKLANGVPFFVMEHLDGSDLRQVLRREGCLATSRAVDYVLQALQAIAEGHRKHVVHRDLKPSNLFLSARADGSPLIKVLDFGIAKWAESSESPVASITDSGGSVLGSPVYMPPEQLRDAKQADERSDIWALGATLYELLTGSPPFRAPLYADLVSQILNDPVEPASLRRPDAGIPAKLSEVLTRCLEKVPAHRFGDTIQLAAALVPFGSEDGRLSYDRIRGLSRSSRPPAVHRAPPTTEDATCTTTQVPNAANSLSRREPRRLAFALGGLVAALGMGGGVWWTRAESLPERIPAGLQRQLAPARTAPSVGTTGNESTAASAIPSPGLGLGISTQLVKEVVAASMRPPNERPRRAPGKSPKPSRAPSAAPATPPSSSATVPPPRPGIEDLITDRH